MASQPAQQATTEQGQEHWSRREESGEGSPGITDRIKQTVERLTGDSDGER